MREMLQNTGTREFLDGPGRARERQQFQTRPKHLQIGYIWPVKIGQSRAEGAVRNHHTGRACGHIAR